MRALAARLQRAIASRRVALGGGGVHTPCAEQPRGQRGWEQSKPPQPWVHTHVPGAAQRPWPEQPAGQCGTEQPAPTHPPEHAHTPGANDLFSTQLHMAAALPATDPSPFSSKRREGPFTPRDNLRPNGQFA